MIRKKVRSFLIYKSNSPFSRRRKDQTGARQKRYVSIYKNCQFYNFLAAADQATKLAAEQAAKSAAADQAKKLADEKTQQEQEKKGLFIFNL
jgi:uncharacterized protein (DUF2147 family)